MTNLADPPDPLPSDPRELTAKLPVWARNLIDRLRMAADQWRRYAIAARLETGPNSLVVLDHYSSTPIGLPAREYIYFRDPNELDRNGRPEALMSARFDDGVLVVSSLNGEPLLIVPSASNVARLMAAPRSLRSQKLW